MHVGLRHHSRTYHAVAAFAMMAGEWAKVVEFCARGIAKNSSLDAVALCWATMIAGHLGQGNVAEADAALARAESMMAAIDDPQVRYWVLYARATMAYAVDPASMPAAVAGLAEFAHQTGAPWMLNGTRQRQANLCLSLGDYVGARHAFRDSYTMAVAAGSPLDEGAAGAGMIEATLSGDDAVPTAECHEIVTRLHDTRNWANLEWSVETIGNYFARVGQVEIAGVILGYLDAHVAPWPGSAARHRDLTRQLVQEHPDAARLLAHGAGLKRDEFVAFALDQLPVE
jgi:predicted protein tyrosine phosphatase